MDRTGNRRLLRDLAAVGLLLEERVTASQRLESQLGQVLARTLSRSLAAGPEPQVAPSYLGRPSRAA